MKKIFILTISLFCLASCATPTLNKKRQDQIVSYAIKKSVISPNAYQKPNGSGEPPDMAAGFAIAGGVIPAMIAVGVQAQIIHTRQVNFERDYSEFYDQVEVNAPTNLSVLLDEAMTNTLSENDFFSTRSLESSSDYAFENQINEFGFMRLYVDAQGDVQLGLFIRGTLKFTKFDGSTFMSHDYYVVSEEAFTMEQYASSKEYGRLAARDALKAFSEMVNYRTEKMFRKEEERDNEEFG